MNWAKVIVPSLSVISIIFPFSKKRKEKKRKNNL
jgi:hypothetical protein